MYVLLLNDHVQQAVARMAVKQLSEKLHTRVSIGHVRYKLFNVLAVNDLYVEDQQQDTLVFVHELDAHFRLWDFLKNKIVFTSVEFNQLNGNLKIDKKGHSNIEFVIRAFASKEKSKPSNIEYRISHFSIKNSEFSYTDARHSQFVSSDRFNPASIHLHKLNLDVALFSLKKDSFDLDIRDLNAIDRSGFVLSSFRTKIKANNHRATISDLQIKLPQSVVSFNDITAKYDSLAAIKDLNRLHFDLPLAPSEICLADLKAFLPLFKHVDGKALVRAELSGSLSSLHLKKFAISYGRMLNFKADLDVNGLPHVDEAFVFGEINELKINPVATQDFLSKLLEKPVVLPREVTGLRNLHYKGNISGFLTNMVLYGSLMTDLGTVNTDLSLKFENHFRDIAYDGKVRTARFRLGSLLNDKNLGDVAFDFNLKGDKKEKMSPRGEIKATVPLFQFKNYNYRDFRFDGKFDGRGFNGLAMIDDENVHARFAGIIDLTKELPLLDFHLKLNNVDLNALHLLSGYKGARLSLNASTNMIGNSLDNVNGVVKFDSVRFNNKGRVLAMDNLQLIAQSGTDSKRLVVISDILNGSITGKFKISTLGLTFDRFVQNYLPSFAFKNDNRQHEPNRLSLDFRLENTNEISDILELPWKLTDVNTLRGTIDEPARKVDLVAIVPQYITGSRTFDNIYLHIQNPHRQLLVTSRGALHVKGGLMNLFASLTAAKDSVYAQAGWQNSQKITNAGEVRVAAGFDKINGKTVAQIKLLPTQVIISDSIWDIHPCVITYKADSSIYVNNFRFESKKQFLHINGYAASDLSRGMKVDLNDLRLEYIFSLINLKSISIGGAATGSAVFYGLTKKPFFETDLKVKGLTMNGKWIGNSSIHGSWDKEHSNIHASALFADDANNQLAKADGVYVPSNDSLDFVFDANHLNVAFLGRYFESVVNNFGGYASGKIRMFGPTHNIGFEAKAFISQGQANVNITKTNYFFNDSITLTRKSIVLNNIQIFDSERNRGVMTGLITHTGNFSHMNYHVVLDGKNIQALNTKATDNDYFFGKAYADGHIEIKGNDKEAQIMVNAVSRPNSRCFVNIRSASSATDNSFITYVNRKSNYLQGDLKHDVKKTTRSDFNVKVNIQMEVTPDADMELLIDPKGGDMMTGRGDGNLRVEFDSYTPIKLFGNYTIQNNGYYLFTMQNLFRKEFKIDKGSTIAWTGDPYHAQLNIRALYPLSASLKDLDNDLTASNRSTVPVNCVLKLNDDLMKPMIRFDVELPQCDESTRQFVRNVMNTEEMMNRQILYLLVFGKFYTPEYMQAATGNIGANNAYALGLNTLSAQINGWLSKAFTNFSIGLEYKPSDAVNNQSEFSTQVNYQPNNRVIVNGNFGYSTENVNVSNTNNHFINDIDVEYLLNESGKIRLKAYNHTVDRIYTDARNTQGAGVVYKEDFKSVGDMLRHYWKVLTGWTTKKKTDEKKN